jgi:hypothetical protein
MRPLKNPVNSQNGKINIPVRVNKKPLKQFFDCLSGFSNYSLNSSALCAFSGGRLNGVRLSGSYTKRRQPPSASRYRFSLQTLAPSKSELFEQYWHSAFMLFPKSFPFFPNIVYSPLFETNSRLRKSRKTNDRPYTGVIRSNRQQSFVGARPKITNKLPASQSTIETNSIVLLAI